MRLPCSESPALTVMSRTVPSRPGADEVDRAEVAAGLADRGRDAREAPGRGWHDDADRQAVRGGGGRHARSLERTPSPRPGTVRIVPAQPKDLDLNDAPARASQLFLIDGNSLGYRAFYALPEELATSDGFPTNALLGFANMLMRLLGDYRPRRRARRLGRAPDAPAREASRATRRRASRRPTCCASSSRTSARSSRRSATATCRSRATRPTT